MYVNQIYNKRDYHPRSVRNALERQGWVVIAFGPEDSQRAAALLRHRVYGGAICLKRRASTAKVGNFIIGWLHESQNKTLLPKS